MNDHSVALESFIKLISLQWQITYCCYNTHIHLWNFGEKKEKKLSNENSLFLFITNWGKFVSKIGAALFYYKLGQFSYYKLG